MSASVQLKIIVVGKRSVGKTRMIYQFAQGSGKGAHRRQKSMGTDYMEKEIVARSTGQKVNVMLWDVAGGEESLEWSKRFYKGTGAVVFAFSTTDRASFESMIDWRQKVHAGCGTNVPAVLVQTKVDLQHESRMDERETEELAEAMNLKLYRITTDDDKAVAKVFEYLVESFVATGARISAPPLETMTSISSESFNRHVPAFKDVASRFPPYLEEKEPASVFLSIPEQDAPMTRRTGGKKTGSSCVTC